MRFSHRRPWQMQCLICCRRSFFSNPDTKFLDPACKSGVFLREIAKRLRDGLEHQIPDLNERMEHIFKNQIYGIAITELTSLISRRSLYCSAYPDSEYSVVRFDNSEGNIRYRNTNHIWVNGKCKFCNISNKNILGEKKEMLIWNPMLMNGYM